jgi:polyisoprenoid-binding protein YceI
MIRVGVLYILIFLSSSVIAQDKYASTYVCTKGKVHFFSKTPLEDIDATTLKAVCVLNTATRKVYTTIPVNSFQFPNRLMQEHFNENYIESHKYPFSIYDATIVETNLDFTKDTTYNINLSGILELHGVKKEKLVQGTITFKNGEPVAATAEFVVALVDYKIDIPKAVIMNIAETIKIDLSFVFVKYQKS